VKLSKYHRERDVRVRSQQAYALRQTGMTYKKIGTTLQPPVSGNRAWQLVQGYERRLAREARIANQEGNFVLHLK